MSFQNFSKGSLCGGELDQILWFWGRNQILKRLIREFKSTNQIWKSDRYFIRRGVTLLASTGNLWVTNMRFCISGQFLHFQPGPSKTPRKTTLIFYINKMYVTYLSQTKISRHYNFWRSFWQILSYGSNISIASTFDR